MLIGFTLNIVTHQPNYLIILPKSVDFVIK